jgi:hypothetical protein
MHQHLVDTAPDDREKQRLLRVAQPHAGSFVTAVPSNEDGNDTLLRPRVFRTAVLYRLGLPVLNQPKPCPSCMQTINIYGDHATCCAKKGDLIIRHNAIRNLVNAIACDGVLSPQMEKKGILGPTSGRRPGDVTIPNWSGSPLAIDVAVTSPIIATSVRLNSPCEEYAANQKHRKYDASFAGSDYSFCAMVFETLGAVNQEGEEVLRQLFRYAAAHLGREFSSYCVRAWARFSCTLQRSVAQAILNRIDGTEQEPEPDGVAVSEALGQPGVSEGEASVCERETSETKQPETKQDVLASQGFGEEGAKPVVVAVGCSSSGSIPSTRVRRRLNNLRREGPGGIKEDGDRNSRVYPSRGGSGVCIDSISVVRSDSCALVSSGSSSPKCTVKKDTTHSNTRQSAEGLCGTTDELPSDTLPRGRSAGPL